MKMTDRKKTGKKYTKMLTAVVSGWTMGHQFFFIFSTLSLRRNFKSSDTLKWQVCMIFIIGNVNL